jgi:hypothetical protein
MVSWSDECASGTDVTTNPGGKTQQSGHSWYARLPDDRKAEYIRRQHLARQKKKAVTRTGVNCLQSSHTGSAALQSYTVSAALQRTPLSNITNTHAKGT